LTKIVLPWQELAEDTYRSVFTQSKTALDLSGVWLMVAVLLAFLGLGIYPILTPDDLGGIEYYLLAPAILGIFALLGLAIFSTRWARWVMLNHLPAPGRAMAMGKSELLVGWAAFENLLLGVAPVVAASWYGNRLVDSGQFEAGFALQAAGILVGAFLLARSGMAINLAALQLPNDALGFAWRISAGQTVRLLLLLIITAGPAVLAAWGIDWMLEWALAPMPDLLGPEMQKALAVAMMSALGFLGLMLFLAAMGLAARSLILARGEDPWAEVGDVEADYAEEGDGVLETSLGDMVEEPLPQQAYVEWAAQAEEDPLLLRATDMVDERPPESYEQLVPVESQSWVEEQAPQAQPAPAQTPQRRTTWVADEKALGRKISAAKKTQSWTRFLPTLEFDMGADAWKLAVLVVLMILGYLFLFTDVIENYLL
jgi:hypothetical protein